MSSLASFSFSLPYLFSVKQFSRISAKLMAHAFRILSCDSLKNKSFIANTTLLTVLIKLGGISYERSFMFGPNFRAKYPNRLAWNCKKRKLFADWLLATVKLPLLQRAFKKMLTTSDCPQYSSISLWQLVTPDLWAPLSYILAKFWLKSVSRSLKFFIISLTYPLDGFLPTFLISLASYSDPAILDF